MFHEPQPFCSHRSHVSPRRSTSGSAQLSFTPIQSRFFIKTDFTSSVSTWQPLAVSLSLSLFAWLFVCFDTQKPHLPSVCHPTLLLSFMCRIHSFIFFFSFCLCDQTCQSWHLIFFKNAFIWKTDTKAARRRVRVGVNH